MWNSPGREAFTKAEWELIERLRTPRQVQRYLRTIPYNWELEGGTLRSFREVVKLNTAHCLEAALAAAVILEQHGYPPLLLSFESKDLLDHVLFAFQERGLWGAIGRSRDLGLHGRKPRFRSVRDLAWSYFDTYVDYTGRILGYAVTNLYELGGYDWRFSPRNMWKIENYLREVPHKPLPSSDSRYERLLRRYKEFRESNPTGHLTDYASRPHWML
jgi:hypothetical protein